MPDQTAQADTEPFPTEPCSSCTAPVVWAHTPDGRQPFDAAPVDVNAGEPTHLLRQDGGLIQAIPVTNKAQLFGRPHGWRARICRFDRERARGLVARYNETHPEGIVRTMIGSDQDEEAPL